MAPLQDSVPAKSFAVVRKTIEGDYKKDLFDVFSSFEETPIGAASIGQVRNHYSRRAVFIYHLPSQTSLCVLCFFLSCRSTERS